MEHYFIYICNERPTSEEHTLVLNYINSLLPIPSNINHVHTNINSVPILKCNSSYLAVINDCSREKTIQWTQTTLELDLNHLIAGFNKDDSQKILEEDLENGQKSLEDSNKISKELEESQIKNYIEKDRILSTYLNNLADELPINGTYKLDVIISQKVLKGLSDCEGIEFAGSLYRLFRWHLAHTTIVVPPGEDELNLELWCEIVDAELLKGKIDPFLGPVIWRGSIQFKNPDLTFSGFHLRLDSFDSEITFDDLVSSPVDLEAIPFEHLALSSNFQAIHECSFTSIPIYLILPTAFRLYVCESSVCNENSKKLLQRFSPNNGAALIVRLKYSILHEKLKPDKSLSTSKWQKMISSACIKDPDTSFPVLEKYLTFAITSSPKSGHVVAYPLRDPSSLDAKLYFNAVLWMEPKSKIFKVDSSEKNILTLEAPYLPLHSFHALVNKINLLGLSSKESCCKDKHSSTDDCCCLVSLLESVTKSCPSHPMAIDNTELHVIKEEIDPSDWPERVHLLQKQMELDKEKTNIQPNVFRNLSPRRSQNTISFLCQDAQKYFLPTGEPKAGTNIDSKSIQVTNDSKPINYCDKVQHSKWPEALTFKDDDIYYNCDKQAEDKEAVGNEMVRFYVQHDTACTCNNQQCKTDPTILIRTKSKPSGLKYRSPSAPRFLSRIKKSNSQLDASLAQSNIPTSKLKRSNSNLSVETVSNTSKGKGKQPLKKNAQPVRSSPRKTNAVKYSQSAAKNTIESKRKTSDTQQLPEIMKKKLRVAVASALEKNGIHLKDAFFRPCGKRLFAICQAFVPDLSRQKGSISQHMQKIADAHVKQVIEFERQRETGC